MPQADKRLWMIVLALAAVVVLFAPDSLAADHRLVVKMDEPFEINGTLFPPGVLSIRHQGNYSPVTSLNEIRVDGHFWGVVEGRRAVDNAAAPNDSLIFRRGQTGTLVLHSVALVGESPHRLHLASSQSAGLANARRGSPIPVPKGRP
jgi:hypothetical protein